MPWPPRSRCSQEPCSWTAKWIPRITGASLRSPVNPRPSRQALAYVRKGEFEGIREEIRTTPERKPDFGPCEVPPSAGATAVGARFPLIAYNVYLNPPDVKVARAIAKAVRHSSGGLRYV